MRISPPISARARREGFSLMEILVVLAIFALSAAVIMPSTSRMLDQATSHAVFFEFQEQVSNLRREANRTGVAIRLTEPAPQDAGHNQTSLQVTQSEAPELDPPRTILLRSPWRYTLAPNLDIAAGGACSAATANLINGDRVVMTLRTSGGDCRFIRLQTTEAQPRGPASR